MKGFFVEKVKDDQENFHLKIICESQKAIWRWMINVLHANMAHAISFLEIILATT